MTSNRAFKRFIKYWLAPILLMAVIFPLGNRTLGSRKLFLLYTSIVRFFVPHMSWAAARVAYLASRKTFHFLAYGLLAFFFFRAVKGERREPWKIRWLLLGGVLASLYGSLDEILQTFVPYRTGSPFDWMIDLAGILTSMSLVAVMSRGKSRPGAGTQDGCPSVSTLFVKRAFDILLSSAGLVLSSPGWAFLSILVFLEDGGPVFYCQERIGRKGRIFKAYKFRSMIPEAEKDTGPVQAEEGDVRVTRIGRLMRGTAMDELPQLLNILKGDMSFVGPRALRPAEKEVRGNPSALAIEAIPGYAERAAVKPGLTGLAQVFLPGEAPRRLKFKYDVLYIRRMSPALDFKLIFLSFWITFRGKWEAREDKI